MDGITEPTGPDRDSLMAAFGEVAEGLSRASASLSEVAREIQHDRETSKASWLAHRRDDWAMAVLTAIVIVLLSLGFQTLIARPLADRLERVERLVCIVAADEGRYPHGCPP